MITPSKTFSKKEKDATSASVFPFHPTQDPTYTTTVLACPCAGFENPNDRDRWRLAYCIVQLNCIRFMPVQYQTTLRASLRLLRSSAPQGVPWKSLGTKRAGCSPSCSTLRGRSLHLTSLSRRARRRVSRPTGLKTRVAVGVRWIRFNHQQGLEGDAHQKLHLRSKRVEAGL